MGSYLSVRKITLIYEIFEKTGSLVRLKVAFNKSLMVFIFKDQLIIQLRRVFRLAQKLISVF